MAHKNLTASGRLPDGLISYGPNENCTLANCKVEWSVLEYRPSLGASGTFIALFSIALVLHAAFGIRWRTWGYMGCMITGCITEIIGYAGRIIMWYNPFSFNGFLIQISKAPLFRLISISGHGLKARHLVCITFAPVFFCAAIYVTLSQT
jgi:hypothetical protein